MHISEKRHLSELDQSATPELDTHRVKMMRTREIIAKKYREAQIGAAAIQRKKNGGHSHYPMQEARALFAEASGHYLHDTKNLDPDTQLYVSILSVVPRMVEGYHTLNDHNSSRAERHDAKLDMIEFNDSLRSIIDNNPHIQEDVLIGLVKSALLSYGYGAKDVNKGEMEAKTALIGMKHELAFESVLSWLPEGYEILTTTDEDDKHGADFKVRCPNGVILYIDIKATAESAAEATQDNIEFYARFREQLPANQLVLHSGFEREDFDGWRPTNESVQRVLPNLTRQLETASADTLYQQEQARLGRIKVGRHS